MAAPAPPSLNSGRISGGSNCGLDLVFTLGAVLVGIETLGLVVLRPGAVAA
jgi:hypothetical protein